MDPINSYNPKISECQKDEWSTKYLLPTLKFISVISLMGAASPLYLANKKFTPAFLNARILPIISSCVTFFSLFAIFVVKRTQSSLNLRFSQMKVDGLSTDTPAFEELKKSLPLQESAVLAPVVSPKLEESKVEKTTVLPNAEDLFSEPAHTIVLPEVGVSLPQPEPRVPNALPELKKQFPAVSEKPESKNNPVESITVDVTPNPPFLQNMTIHGNGNLDVSVGICIFPLQAKIDMQPQVPQQVPGYLAVFTGMAQGALNAVGNQFGVAEAGFTKHAPQFKKDQAAMMMINLIRQLAQKIDFSTVWEKGRLYLPTDQLMHHLKCKIGVGHPNYQSMADLLDMLVLGKYYNKDQLIVKSRLFTDNTVLQEAPQLRFDFLMKLEKIVQEIKYEEQIEAYLNFDPILRDEKFPHIVILHTIAKHMSETEVWDQATKRMCKFLQPPKTAIPLRKIFESDVVEMERVNAELTHASTLCYTAEKSKVRTGDNLAVTYRYNYSSKMGTLEIGKKQVSWNRTGSPSFDKGIVNKPAELTALYTLYLDSLTAENKKLGFFGLQKSPEINGNNFNGFEPDDYERNRTAIFILASKKSRWKNHFKFTNLSLDQVMENAKLKLKDPKKITSENTASIKTIDFKVELMASMKSGSFGFYGLEGAIVEKAISTVNIVFFAQNQQVLNDKERWSFLILTYAMIVLETIKEKDLDVFHINCKDGIDRAAVINTAVMLVTQFADHVNTELSEVERAKNIQQSRTMFSHAAHFVKEQAVIPSRAPLAYFVADQLDFAKKQKNIAERLAVLGDFAKAKFTPFA